MKSWIAASGALLALPLLAGVASAQAVPGAPLDSPITVSAGVSGTFGAATLISDSEFTQTDLFLLNTSLGLNYQYNDSLSFSAGTGFSQFLTRAGGQNSQFEGRLQDVSLSASLFPVFVEENTGIIVSGGLDLTLPTSDLSLAEGLYTQAGASLTFIRPFGGLILVWGLGYSKNFHEATSVVLDANELDVLARDGGAETLGAGRVAIDGVLPSFSVSNSFIFIYNFAGRYQLRASLAYIDAWTYDNGTITQDDEFVNENAVVGRGHSQTVSGGFGFRALLWGDSFFGRSLAASIGATTGGAPKTDDNNSFRFPFWDFENGIANRTRLNLGLSATF
jgi:hypothetical protein